MTSRVTCYAPLLAFVPFLAAGAQLLDPPYNPIGIYNARLFLFDEALALPTTQRGMRSQQTTLRYLGQHYLLQQRYYNKQGLLDSCLTYDLAQTGDSLTSYLHMRAHYQSRHQRNALVSTVQERWTEYDPMSPPAKRYVARYTRTLSGNLPPAEPFLTAGKRPGHAGTLRQGTQSDTATWRWGRDAATGHWLLSYEARPKRGQTGFVGWQASLSATRQELTCSWGTNGGSWEYVRRYLRGGPAYEERCQSSSAIVGAGGGSLNSQVYTRTTFWQAGLCQREHFVVTEMLVAGTHPAFDVLHTYSY